MYPKCDKGISQIVDALISVGESDTSFKHRREIAEANGILNYVGEPTQNNRMLALLHNGKLRKA